MSTQEQIIEHIVLFNVKPDVDLTTVAAMVDALNSLASLDLAIYVSAGELLRSRSSSLTFSHILHCRFKSHDDLHTFDNHPEHTRVVIKFILPIINDIMAVDWISTSSNISELPKPGSAMRVTLLKLKEGLPETEKNEYFKMLEGIKNQFEAIKQISIGENFSVDMPKGYSICSIIVFADTADLEEFNSDAGLQKSLKEKVKDLAESDVVVDYVIPMLKVAN